jgi:hypothetical protein
VSMKETLPFLKRTFAYCRVAPNRMGRIPSRRIQVRLPESPDAEKSQGTWLLGSTKAPCGLLRAVRWQSGAIEALKDEVSFCIYPQSGTVLPQGRFQCRRDNAVPAVRVGGCNERHHTLQSMPPRHQRAGIFSRTKDDVLVQMRRRFRNREGSGESPAPSALSGFR